jgi:hypothetical protein
MSLVQGLFGRLLSSAGIALGFWLIYIGISRPSVALGILGGAAVLASMYFMVAARRAESVRPGQQTEEQYQEISGDPIDRSDKSD